jgi:hypothetical protein
MEGIKQGYLVNIVYDTTAVCMATFTIYKMLDLGKTGLENTVYHLQRKGDLRIPTNDKTIVDLVSEINERIDELEGNVET